MGQLEWSDIRGGVSPDKLDRLLLIARITSAAPLFGENENTPSEQMTPDFDLKNDISLKGKVMVDLVIISKINLKQKCSAVRKKEVGQLCSIYAATMLKMMKEAYIPDFEGWKKEVMERKTAVWSKEFNARWESFLKERDERVERKRRNSPYHSNRECDGKNGRGTDKRQGIWRERRRLHAGSQGKMGQM